MNKPLQTAKTVIYTAGDSVYWSFYCQLQTVHHSIGVARMYYRGVNDSSLLLAFSNLSYVKGIQGPSQCSTDYITK